MIDQKVFDSLNAKKRKMELTYTKQVGRRERKRKGRRKKDTE